MCLQPSYTPTAMNYDFALITLKSAASASAGYMGMTVGQGTVTMNLTTAGYPVSLPWGSPLSLLHEEGSGSGCHQYFRCMRGHDSGKSTGTVDCTAAAYLVSLP